MEEKMMQNCLFNLRSPTILILMLVLPFMILEWVNRREFHEGYPFALFGILWLLSLIFIAGLVPLVKDIRSGASHLANPVMLLLRMGILTLGTILWVTIAIDQLPCFLGVPFCD